MKKRITWPARAALALCLSPALCAQTVAVFDRSGLGWEERCTVEALQGLVNRAGPRLFLGDGGENDRRWLAIYRERHGLEAEKVESLRALLERFAPRAEGLVVYDPRVDGTRYVAITLAGIEDLLPVSPALEPELLAALGLEVKHDLRGRFDDSMAAYAWALEHVMPRRDRRLAHAVDGRVELEAQGPASAVGRLLAWLHEGPPAARVDEVVVQDRSLETGEATFEVRR